MRTKNMLTIVSVLVLMLIAPTLVYSNNKGIEGTWQGNLPEVSLRVIFIICQKPDGSLIATADSPDQGTKDIPVDEITFKDDNLRLDVKRVEGVFEGKIKEDGLTIEGQWQQRGVSLPLILKRIDEAKIETSGQNDSEIVEVVEKHLENRTSAKTHIITTLILVLVVVGLIGIIVFFRAKSSRR